MTTPPERDDVIARLLRRMPPDAPGSPAEDCIDAERLARWAEGGLSRDERAALLAHTVHCARCQALVFAMMRTAPAPHAGSVPRTPWALVRWGLPLAAAAALAVWFAVDREVVPQRASEPVEQQSSAASAAKVPPPALPDVVAPRSAPQPPGDAAQGRVARPDRSRAEMRDRDVDAARSREARGLKDAPTGTAPADTPPSAAVPLERAPVLTEPSNVARGPVPPAPPPGALPPPPAQVAQGTPAAPAAAPQQIPGGGLAESVSVQSESASAVAADPRRQSRGNWVDVLSADPLVRWRFTRRGDVERSADGGATWTREPVPGPRVELTVGIAPSSSVCWLAGADGIVLRFTTEQGWRRVPLPVRGDVERLAAADAENAWAGVRGREFRTTDGGTTWR